MDEDCKEEEESAGVLLVEYVWLFSYHSIICNRGLYESNNIYSKKKEVWRSNYDILKMMPGAFRLSGDSKLLEEIKHWVNTLLIMNANCWRPLWPYSHVTADPFSAPVCFLSNCVLLVLLPLEMDFIILSSSYVVEERDSGLDIILRVIYLWLLI